MRSARGIIRVHSEHSNEMTIASHARYRAVHILVLGTEPFWEDVAMFDLPRIDELLLSALTPSTSCRPAGLEFEGRPRTSRQLVEALTTRRFRILFGPVVWNPHEAGFITRACALASRWVLRRAEFAKAGLTGAIAARFRAPR